MPSGPGRFFAASCGMFGFSAVRASLVLLSGFVLSGPVPKLRAECSSLVPF